MHDDAHMWADDNQRERIFEMVGTRSVTYHRLCNARLEQQRRAIALAFVAAGVTWLLAGVLL